MYGFQGNSFEDLVSIYKQTGKFPESPPQHIVTEQRTAKMDVYDKLQVVLMCVFAIFAINFT